MGGGRSLTQPCRTPIALLWCLRHMNSVEQCGTVSGACSAGTAGTRGTFLKRRVSVWNSGWVVKPLKPPVCVRSEGAWNTQNTHEHVCKHISYPSTRGNMFIAKRRALWFALVSSGPDLGDENEEDAKPDDEEMLGDEGDANEEDANEMETESLEVDHS